MRGRWIRNAVRVVVGLGLAVVGALVLAVAVLVGVFGWVFVLGFHWINEMDD